MKQYGISEALRALRVPEELLGAVPDLPEDAEGLLIYGSQARGDAIEGSDLDLLVLVPKPRPSDVRGDVSVSFYTPVQLRSGAGTLFGAHLRRDSRVLWDPADQLTHIVDNMGTVDTGRLFDRALQMSMLFTTPQRDLPRYLPGLLRQARYLLRSSLYAQAIEEGRPCFSVREIAERHQDPALVDVLASRQQALPDMSSLHECLLRLQAIIGEFPQSTHGSLEATIVNEWGRRGDLLSAAFLVLGRTGAGSVYAEVEKILL